MINIIHHEERENGKVISERYRVDINNYETVILSVE